ncbi:hypothetical protein IWW40_000855 [Coemansia sp. RSA 1250]|nr:hypothetical protein IWW40_000855 [Coemansia sp. RSA 1250]
MQISIALVFGVLAVAGQATPLPQTQSVVRIGHDASEDQSVVRIGHDRDGENDTEEGTLEEETSESEVSEPSESPDESSDETPDEPSEEPSESSEEPEEPSEESPDGPKDSSTDELSDDEDEVGTSTVFVDSTEIISATISDPETSDAYRNLVSLMSLSVVGVSAMLSAF